jgi:integrase
MTQKVNDFLRRLRLYDKTLPARLSYYYARHSWATIARNDCEIDMQTINEALNHASDANMKITDVYVKKDFTRIWEANRKVLDYVFGSDNK